MDPGITLLEKEEYSQIWDRVYTELCFQPSVYENIPLQVPAPWAVHGLLFEPTGEQGELCKISINMKNQKARRKILC